jgi:chromosomal replication initiator protein
MTGELSLERSDEFEKFQAALHRRFGDKIVSAWMSDLQLERQSGDCVTLSTESQVKADTIGQRFVLLMKDAWCKEVGPIRRLQIITRSRLSAGAAHVGGLAPKSHSARAMNGAAVKSSVKEREERRALALGDLVSPCDERSTFERFAVDDSNRMAYAAARQALVESAPSEVIYIHGASGAGKTHLLHAVANEHRRMRGEGRCAYLTYNALQNGCVNAVFSNGLLDLQKDLLSQDIVLIDDVHLLAGSARTQTEILNLVNASLASGKKLVIAGELAPSKLGEAGINQRLADRLAGGLSVAIAPGDVSLRARVLKTRLETAHAKCKIEDGAIDFIAQTFPQSLREAIGALNQLLLVYGLEDIRVGKDAASAALRARLGDSRRTPTLEEAALAAAAAFDISVEELKGRGQYQRLAKARHAFVMVGREALHESFPRIGRALGRDHTTAMSGYRRGQALYERDRNFRAAVAAIRTAVGAPPA